MASTSSLIGGVYYELTETTPTEIYKELYEYVKQNASIEAYGDLYWRAGINDYITFSAFNFVSKIDGFSVYENRIITSLNNHGGSNLLIYEDGTISINWA